MNTLILAGGIVAVAAIAIGLAVWQARRSGRDTERARAASQSLEHAREANEIDEDVAGLGADALFDELRRPRDD